MENLQEFARKVELPLDDDKYYFVCYVVPGIFDLESAFDSVVECIDFLGFGRTSEDFEPVLGDLNVPFEGALQDLALFGRFVTNSYDMNRNFASIIQVASEVDRSSAKFISVCFVKREKGLLSKDFTKREVER